MLRPAAILLLVAAGSAPGQTVHRYGFDPKDRRTVAFAAADGNVPVKELAHAVSDEHAKTGTTSELIKVEAGPPADPTAQLFAHYSYRTPQAPVGDRLIARLAVWSARPGVQVKARVVLPRERDPQTPTLPLTTLVPGDTYTRPREWRSLGFGNFEDALRRQLPVVEARLGRRVDAADAFVDQLVVNVYTGPGVSEVWVDDLEIGPVRADAPPPAAETAATPANRRKPTGLAVEMSDGQIRVQSPEDGELRPFFPLFARYTDTDPAFLFKLRNARLNTLVVPPDAPPEAVEEAVRHGFWLAPTVPLPAAGWKDGKPQRPDPEAVTRDADRVGDYVRKFLARDAVLMWDLGAERVAEDIGRVARVSEVLRRLDPRRPRSVGLWDGFGAYATYATAIEFHRDPLFSSLELGQYRDWLDQKRALVGGGRFTWGWVQNHVPDWLNTNVGVLPGLPTGPHPEQLRALAYLHLASGQRGLGFWSDRAAYFPDVLPTDGCHGRDLYLEMWLITAEIEMLQGVLGAAPDPAVWVGTNNGNVQAAIARGPNDILVLPVWLGFGTQHVPPQAVVSNLQITVPAVPEGAVPFLITPAGVVELKGVTREAGGSKITIPEFDVGAAVVFTTDLKARGKVARWQDHTRIGATPVVAPDAAGVPKVFEWQRRQVTGLARQAAEVAHKQATDQYHKTLATHTAITAAGGPELSDGRELFDLSQQRIAESKLYYDNNQFYEAYREARRAVWPLRAIQRADWEEATRTLDTPTASPYAASYFTLPLHWPFAREVGCSRPAGNGLAHGGFELSRKAPEQGSAVTALPGWTTSKLILDPVDGLASIVNVPEGLYDRPPEPPPVLTNRFNIARVGPLAPDFRQPALGGHCLKLELKARQGKGRDAGLPPPQAVERTVVRVDSPACEFPPGQLVRVSFWAKTGGVGASADGLVVFDSAGGEPLGVRIRSTYSDARKATVWKQWHLYRRVPASGKISVSVVLTGLGEAFVDEVCVEPLVPATGVAAQPGPLPTLVPAGGPGR